MNETKDAKVKKVCFMQDDRCKGKVHKVVDPYALEIDNIEQKIIICEYHLEQRYLDI